MPVLRVLLMLLAMLGVAIIAGGVSGALWYAIAHASGTLPPFSAFLLPALVACGLLFGWLLGRSPVYPGARTLAVVCILFIPLRVLIAAVTEDTDVGAALFNSIVFAGVLYATARLTRPRQTGESSGEAI
jgi:hypothetical protein